MAIVTRRAGDDIPISISLTDANGAVMSIDDLAELYVYVIHTTSNTILVKFSKAGTDGFTALTKVSSTVYRADVLSGLTKAATLGEYNIDMNVVETDADFEDSQKNTIGIQGVFNLKDSTSKAKSSG